MGVLWKWMVVVVNVTLQMHLVPLSYMTLPSQSFFMFCQKGKEVRSCLPWPFCLSA